MRPQWFPDNRSLFLHMWNGKLNRFDTETGELKALEAGDVPVFSRVGNVGYRSHALVAPDGRTLYYAARDTNPNFCRILKRALAGGAEQELARINSSDIGSLAISRDGSRLVIQYPAPPETVLVTLPTSGGELKRIHSAPAVPGGYLHCPMWSADGRRIFFLGGHGKGNLMSVPSEGGEAESLNVDMHDLYHLNVHPDGAQLVFADEQWNRHLWVARNLVPAAK
ncbi:MAG: PD40 domain-containing protein [Acidobacteria bacterium]|nr:PD40 domain-containing protein [Acidobacteriota bacterium]